MLHDHRLQSDSGSTPFATQYHQHQHHARRRVLSHHQFDNDQYVSNVPHATWTGPRHDVISPHCFYNQRPTWSSVHVCGQSSPASTATPVTASQWPYVAARLQPTTDWTSLLPAAVTNSRFWGCTHHMPHDRMLTHNKTPRSSPAEQFSTDYSSTDGIVFDCGQRSSSNFITNITGSSSSSSSTLTPINSELDALTTSNYRTTDNERHHQQTHISTLPLYPLQCTVSVDTPLIDSDTVHQFGTKPTRASTSIGTYSICHHRLSTYYFVTKVGLELLQLFVCIFSQHIFRL